MNGAVSAVKDDDDDDGRDMRAAERSCQGAKGILTTTQCLCPSIRAWHLPGTLGIKFILEEAKGNTPSTGKGGKPHTLLITLQPN